MARRAEEDLLARAYGLLEVLTADAGGRAALRAVGDMAGGPRIVVAPFRGRAAAAGDAPPRSAVGQ